jgi:hypothetical protein
MPEVNATARQATERLRDSFVSRGDLVVIMMNSG